LGHPVGATGTIIATKAIHELHRTNGRYALVTMSIGGGQGIVGLSPVGASLLAMRECHSTSSLTDPPPSRASSLPQVPMSQLLPHKKTGKRGAARLPVKGKIVRQQSATQLP
jgi:hypothetical protein